MAAPFTYPEEFVETLYSFGLAPTSQTEPASVRHALSGLYKYELRRLRGRLLSGEFDRLRYLDLIIELRKKYWLLTLPEWAWEKICRGGATSPPAD
jgi:hypothetical protein